MLLYHKYGYMLVSGSRKRKRYLAEDLAGRWTWTNQVQDAFIVDLREAADELAKEFEKNVQVIAVQITIDRV